MTNIKKLPSAINFALFASAASLVSGSVVAQESGETTTLDRIEVTGSRIKRAEIEGPNPVTVISREQIDVSGELSVSDFLRNNVYNSLGSVRESSGSATGSNATINLRGIGSNYTLVLLDGRRMTSSPTLSGGGAANINLIPMAAVERIEILREGAGAIYGSDAIGGVVNIILRKDYDGLTIGGGIGRPDRGPDESNAYIAGGVSSDRGNLTFAIDHQSRDMMYNREIRDLISPAQWIAGLSPYNSVANFSSTTTGFTSVANCDQFENSIRDPEDGNCYFDHGATSANESSLRRDSLMLNGNYQLTDRTSFFFRAISSETKSLGVYASAPVAGSTPLPTISATNPNNPFGVAGTLYYRFTPLGTRDSHRTDTLRDVNFGLRGSNDWFGGADWEVGVTHGRVKQSSVNYNYGIFSALQAAIDSGQFNPFVPTDPGVAAAAPSIGHTVLVESNYRTVGVDGSISFDLWETSNGPVSFVTGFDYRDDRLEQTYDPQSAANNVFGSAGAGAGGERAYYAGYFEALIPLLSTLNLTVAGRYDHYNDFGSKFSPRVSLEFRPIDSLLVRGSWGKGFRAPTLSDLYGDLSSTNLAASAQPGATPPHPGGDERACAALTQARANLGNPNYNPYPVNVCGTTAQYTFLVGSNPNLEAEESENWGVGLVFSPTDSLSVSLDYYSVELTNAIASAPNALAIRWGEDGTGAPYGVTRQPDFLAADGVTMLPGAITEVLNPTANGAANTFKGVDLDVRYGFSPTSLGNFTTQLTFSRQLENDYTPKGLATIEQAGTFQFPEDRGQLVLGWSLGDFGASATVNHIGHHQNNATVATPNPIRIPSWNTFDVQANWSAPWNGKITIGVRNLGNKTPPIGSASGFPFYSNTLYNAWGRVPYMRYEQRF